MATETPPGWCQTTLGDVLRTIEAGKSPKAEGRPPGPGEVGVLKVSAVSWGEFNPDESKMLPAGLPDNALTVSDGDLLISRANTAELVGAVVLVGGDHPNLMLSDKTLRLRTSPEVDDRFLLHALRTRSVRQTFGASATGTSTSMRNLSQGKIKSAPVLLAPKREQKRIVAKLEALRARADAAKAALDAIPPLLERFRQSVLAAAFRGDLTKAWRAQNPDVEPASALLERIRAERRARWIEAAAEKGRARAEAKAAKAGKPWSAEDDAKVLERERAKAAKKYKAPGGPDTSNGTPSLPDSWAVASVGEVSECLDRVRRPITRKDRSPGPYPYYGANGQVDSVADYLFDEELVLVTEDETFYGRTKPIAYRVSGKCWVNNHAHVLRALGLVPPDYLCQSLMHFNVIPWLSGTTGRAKLTQGAMNVLPLALAPADEMMEVATRVSELLEFADSVERTVVMLHKPQAKLNQSILAKAFRGELVPQDPNDEPASALLARIRAEREAAAAAKPKRKRRKPKPKKGQQPLPGIDE